MKETEDSRWKCGGDTYFTDAREGELSVHVLVDITDVQGKLQKINIEVSKCMCYRLERG